MMTLLIKMLVPYVAVGVFWSTLSNAWLAILAYHALILYWSREATFKVLQPTPRTQLMLALPTLIAGPLVYYLLPVMTQGNLSGWLVQHHLSMPSLLAMIPYFGIVHPWLEQTHWGQLRERTPFAHVLFAGYHMLVLQSLMSWPWLMFCFGVLTAASYLWKQMAKLTKGLTVPIVSHVMSDLGIVIVAWLRT
jgi:hypothetical protein